MVEATHITTPDQALGALEDRVIEIGGIIDIVTVLEDELGRDDLVHGNALSAAMRVLRQHRDALDDALATALSAVKAGRARPCRAEPAKVNETA